MALVPADFVNSPKVTPSGIQLNQLDREMKRILDDTSIDPDIKFKLYNQVLREHDEIRASTQKPIEVPILEPKTEEKSQLPPDSLLLSGIPPKKHPNASVLLEFLKSTKGIKWNTANELLVDGKPIEGSNALSLFHYTTRDLKSQQPVGWREFKALLERYNAPREAIGNVAMTVPIRGGPVPSGSRLPTPTTPANTRSRSQIGRGRLPFKWHSLYK